DQFGGHKYAAGLTMKEENIPLFQAKFEDVVHRSIKPEMLQQEISIELPARLQDIDGKFYRVLRQFEPFGPDNEAPIFITKQVSAYGKASIVGNNHLKFSIFQDGSPVFDCIAFGQAEYVDVINSN